MSEAPEKCESRPLMLEFARVCQVNKVTLSGIVPSESCPFARLDLANAEMLKKCACVFVDGECVEECKYHGDAIRGKDAEIERLRDVLDEIASGVEYPHSIARRSLGMGGRS